MNHPFFIVKTLEQIESCEEYSRAFQHPLEKRHFQLPERGRCRHRSDK